MHLLIQPLQLNQIDSLVDLAEIIWHKHYDSIIGSDQVNYMLAKFQNEKAILQQQADGYQYYAAIENSILVGYFSIKEEENNSLFISKFYLSDQVRGKGYGRDMLQFIESLAINSEKRSLDLTVNKFNSAFDIYLKLGFEKVGNAQFDIGGGYIMDDFVLKKRL